MTTMVFEKGRGIVQKEVCDYCEGSGIIATDESDGEGHIMQGVGTAECICQIEN